MLTSDFVKNRIDSLDKFENGKDMAMMIIACWHGDGSKKHKHRIRNYTNFLAKNYPYASFTSANLYLFYLSTKERLTAELNELGNWEDYSRLKYGFVWTKRFSKEMAKAGL